MSKTSKGKSVKSATRNQKWYLKTTTRLLIVGGIFGLIGVGYFLYQTLAAPQTVNYWGTLTKDNPTASYRLTTGEGVMKITFSNNTGDLVLSIINNKGTRVGTLASVGPRDVYLKVPVTPGMYTLKLTPPKTAPKNWRRGYSLHVSYPTNDATKPTAIITSPTGKLPAKGTVDFNVSTSDDKKLLK